tara:strand:- start:80 stop:337 length:258 start_codon:yes stop_codon:yes gene_type:complete
MKQSGNKNIQFKKTGYQKWSYGDWVINNNAIGYSIENKVENFYANTDSLKNARDFVTCKVLDIDWLKIGSKEWLEKKDQLINGLV